MLNDLLKIANLYDEGLKHVQSRRDQWLKKHVELKDHLKEMADYLNTNAAYKQGFFIDTMHAFNEENGGTCAEMPSITFRSGNMPMQVSFKNGIGEKKEYNEEGFRITFTPTITGQLIVLLFPHISDINKGATPQYATLSIIDNPEQLTMELAEQIIEKGMQGAFYSSFTGMGEPGEAENEQITPLQAPKHNPIGFKRYETTERLANHLLYMGIMLICSCNNEHAPASTSGNNAADSSSIPMPAAISYDIVNEYPHDPAAFTEGLEYKDGFLYESTGQYGISDIRKVDLKTGKVLVSTKMEPRYFGEGMTMLNGKIYQLTYREGKGFIYNAATLKKEGTFTINTPEGWGMTNNGACLIFDDGSNVLHYLDPNTLKEVKQLAVTDEHGPVNEINEPELIHGYIYANQWQTDYILKIDTTTGKVVARADLGTLRQRTGIPPVSGNPHGPDVLNGIAYDAANNRIFITGKNWPKLFEIKLDN